MKKLKFLATTRYIHQGYIGEYDDVDAAKLIAEGIAELYVAPAELSTEKTPKGK